MTINIDDLTLGQIKQIQALNALAAPQANANPNFKQVQGRYVLARTRNSGVIFGKVVEADYGYLHLVEARRLWRHISKDTSQSWYEGVANSGLGDNSRVSAEVERFIVEDYELIPCSNAAIESIKGFKTNETDI